MPRFHCPGPIAEGQSLELAPGAARHVQVLRLQPGSVITLFNGEGGEYEAVVERMGRSDVQVRVVRHHAIEREVTREIHLAVGMPANERMDWLVEKAAELGVASIRPLIAQRSVLKLSAERAEKKRAHWQGIAIAACEQCGRNRVPRIHEPQDLGRWIEDKPEQPLRLVLSLDAGARALMQAADGAAPLLVLSGPEGGLSVQEERAAIEQGFQPVSLGARVLRAETAPLAVLATLTLCR